MGKAARHGRLGLPEVAAGDAVHQLSGVVGLTNELTVGPSASAADVKLRIDKRAEACRRS